MKTPETVDLNVTEPAYRFVSSDALVFVTGAPLSGKSTVAPLVAGAIEGCTIQNMDILRLAAQYADALKPSHAKNPVLAYGSCDSYLAFGDGSYSPQNLVEGYKANANAIVEPLLFAIPKLETQNATRILFEGVQLMPDLVASYLNSRNRLFVITASENCYDRNRLSRYGENLELASRYSTDRLLLIQDEILDQAAALSDDKVHLIENSDTPLDSAKKIVRLLCEAGIISLIKA